jgi:hypothetical protein
MDAVADLEFGIAEQLAVLFAGHELRQPPCLGVQSGADTGVNRLGLGFLFRGQRLFGHGVGLLAGMNFRVSDHNPPFWQSFHLLSRRLPCRVRAHTKLSSLGPNFGYHHLVAVTCH